MIKLTSLYTSYLYNGKLNRLYNFQNFRENKIIRSIGDNKIRLASNSFYRREVMEFKINRLFGNPDYILSYLGTNPLTSTNHLSNTF